MLASGRPRVLPQVTRGSAGRAAQFSRAAFDLFPRSFGVRSAFDLSRKFLGSGGKLFDHFLQFSAKLPLAFALTLLKLNIQPRILIRDCGAFIFERGDELLLLLALLLESPQIFRRFRACSVNTFSRALGNRGGQTETPRD